MALRTPVIGFPRWTAGVTFAGGAWETDYPLSNLKVLPLAFVARSADLLLASTQFTGTFAKPRPVRHLGFVRHNASLDARFRIRLYADLAMTELAHDTDWQDFWPPVYPAEQVEWEDDQWWSGRYATEEIEGYVWTRQWLLPQIVLARAFKVEIDDQLNAAGTFELGLFEVAQGWQSSEGFDLGARYGLQPRTRVVEAEGGVEYPERRDAPRVFQGVLRYLPRDEALARAFEHLRQTDLDVPFLWLPDPGDPTHWVRNAFLAKNVDPELLTYALPTDDSVVISLKEVL